MATPSELLVAVEAALGAALPPPVACELYAGQFDAAETSRPSFVAPACFVVLLGATPGDDPGSEEVALSLRLGVYIATRNGRGRSARTLDAVGIAETVLLTLGASARWGLAGVGPARLERLENLYSGPVDGAGLALWAITWTQEVRFGTSVWDASGVIPSTVWSGVAPDIGTGHEPDYTAVTG